jgi:preprotein translocase subunit SecA
VPHEFSKKLMIQLLRKLFDTSKRDVENLQPMIDSINAMESEITALNDDQLKDRCHQLKHRARGGEKLDDLMVEAFACVREVSKRTLGMRQFDVQLIGGLVLHQGRIAEMKTGEGKTLVAVAPIILNALTGKGSHLVTVNDYLARRDAVWMGPVYHFFGLSVGIIQGQDAESDELGGSYIYEPGCDEIGDPRYVNLRPSSRRESYSCDITYGTNHEFGFDYLRDNMSFSEEDLNMSNLNFAIIDEVDSILIDEARTPHIISGPSMEDVSMYQKVDAIVRVLTPETHWTANKKDHNASLTEEGMDTVEQMMEIDNLASDPKLFHYVNASVKAYGLFTRDIDYVVKGGEVIIVDENTGRMMFGRRFSDGLHQALEAKEKVKVQRESQTIATITFQNLFRLYEKLSGMTGTAKTEEDEFRKIYGLDVVSVPTHRPSSRTDQADIIYKALEAKFRGMGWEILRLWSKQQPVLVGTRSIEMSERVSERLQADYLQKLLITKRLQMMVEESKELKGDEAKDARRYFEMELSELSMSDVAMFLGKIKLPTSALDQAWLDWALKTFEVGATNQEFLVEALSHGIPHNVLNAKFHEQEAVIIAEAGRKGAVTIATNMAGRGVDILLGGRVDDEVVKQARAKVEIAQDGVDEYGETFVSYRRGGLERAAPPLPLSDSERRTLAEEVRALGGLFIIGTERHESRRIDNQLRGRAGRQGDPGESRFFVSLEDHLWKIFNPNMLENPMLKAWPPMEQVNAGFLSKMIHKTQERIENHFFEARKNVLEYDDVLNAQREHIYGLRREVLLGKDVRAELRNYIDEVIADISENAWMIEEDGTRVFDHSILFEDINEIFPLVDYCTVSELEKYEPGRPVVEFVQGIAQKAYDVKVDEAGESVNEVERFVMLRAVNDRWMEHLQLIDYIREGIGLRGYGQVDPLVAYKRETYDTFQNTLKNIREQASKMLFQVQIQPESVQQEMMMEALDAPLEDKVIAEPGSLAWPDGADPKRTGRNDLCPCGSGLKFKQCHYPIFRAEGKA